MDAGAYSNLALRKYVTCSNKEIMKVAFSNSSKYTEHEVHNIHLSIVLR